jgi:hypothetical protein
MSNFKSPRVRRGPPPAKEIKRHKYADVLPELLRDFQGRCAYSMQHQEHAGKLEVDHFDPRRKKDLRQEYENLFPASRHCNGKKSDHWPTKLEIAAGCRFLNPCEETDYGEQIFEDSRTHLVLGTTPAARWHIRICSLNADQLVRERETRAKYWDLLENKHIRVKKTAQDLFPLIKSFREEVEKMIPKIPPAPPITNE